MASIIKKPLKEGGCSWQVFVTMTGFPRITATFPTKEEAEKFGQAQEADFKSQRKLHGPSRSIKASPSKGNLLKDRIADLIGSFLVSGRASAQERRNHKVVMRLVENGLVCDIDEYWIEDYIAKARAAKSNRDAPYAYHSICKQLFLIKKSIHARARNLRIPRPPFPFRKSMFPKGWDAPRKRRLKPNEQRALFGAFRKLKGARRDHWWLMSRLALLTGARLQEVALTEWGDFELEHCQWKVPAHRCKTGQDRVIPLGSRARLIMRLLHNRRDPDSPRVFHSMGTPGACSQQFRKIARASGVVGFRFHDFRHEAVSRMYLQGKLTQHEIMVIVGHSSIEQTRAYVEMNTTEVASRMR
ncbi:site-specific integrase [Burkholderia gladioli]|uniref:site-specific integrase n=1 Tax=Burkholderia gladioli TaxID=28095 RepID=UPI001640DEFC|nr:site-specific integrase [Burkholderia gladioli]